MHGETGWVQRKSGKGIHGGWVIQCRMKHVCENSVAIFDKWQEFVLLKKAYLFFEKEAIQCFHARQWQATTGSSDRRLFGLQTSLLVDLRPANMVLKEVQTCIFYTHEFEIVLIFSIIWIRDVGSGGAGSRISIRKRAEGGRAQTVSLLVTQYDPVRNLT